MINLSVYSLVTLFFFIATDILPLSAISTYNNEDCINKQNNSRKLSSKLPSTILRRTGLWFTFGVINDSENDDDLYLERGWAIFISSNETIFSDEACSLFRPLVCSSPNCYEDTSSLFSTDCPRFSSENATRLTFKTEMFSLANGAWRVKSSPLYIHGCNKLRIYGVTTGSSTVQIGLGISGSAYQNFQTANPIFSIIFHSEESAEIIFGFNSSYVNDTSTKMVLPCDLDWKIEVQGMSIGELNFTSSPVVLIFDLQVRIAVLPPAYYYALKDYLFGMKSLLGCFDVLKPVRFVCLPLSKIEDIPPLIFTTKNGNPLILSPEKFMIISSMGTITIEIELNDATLSGVEYIILGREVMPHFYTVFRNVDNQTSTITLYPRNLSKGDIQQDLVPSEDTAAPNVNDSSDADISQPDSPVNPPADSERETSLIYNEDSSEQNDSLLVVIGVILFVLIVCAVIFYMYRVKRRHLRPTEEVAERQRSSSTLELNESSHFVNSSHHASNDNDNELVE